MRGLRACKGADRPTCCLSGAAISIRRECLFSESPRSLLDPAVAARRQFANEASTYSAAETAPDKRQLSGRIAFCVLPTKPDVRSEMAMQRSTTSISDDESSDWSDTLDGSWAALTNALLPSAVHDSSRPRWSVHDARDTVRREDCVRKAVTLPWCQATSGASQLLIFNDDDSGGDDDAAAADEEVAAALAPPARTDDSRPPLRYNVAACRLSPLWNSERCEPACSGDMHHERHPEPIACGRWSASSATAGTQWPPATSGASNSSPLSSGAKSRSGGSSSSSRSSNDRHSVRYYDGGGSSAGATKPRGTHPGVAASDYERASARRRHFQLRSAAVRSAFTLVDASSAMKVTGV